MSHYAYKQSEFSKIEILNLRTRKMCREADECLYLKTKVRRALTLALMIISIGRAM